MVHAVIAGLAPGADRIDITHDIPPHDVGAGALALWRAAPWLAPGVILGVVDPGVGSERRAVALRVAEAGAVLIGPDNGLLLPAARRLGSVTDAVALTGTSVGGATFAGRDVFAPAAGRIAAGADMTTLGPAIDPDSLIGRAVPVPATDAGGRIVAEVLWVDRFGNAQLSAGPDDTGPGPVRVNVRRFDAVLRIVSSYADIGSDELALVVDSSGLLSVSADRASAAARLGVRAGDQVRLAPESEGHR